MARSKREADAITILSDRYEIAPSLASGVVDHVGALLDKAI